MSIYQQALLYELRLQGMAIETELKIDIRYKDHLVGVHRLDMMVEQCVIVELKAVNAIAEVHVAQTLSYLKATGLEASADSEFRRAESRMEKARKKPSTARGFGTVVNRIGRQFAEKNWARS